MLKLVLILFLFLPVLAFAQNCPGNTAVNGDTVTFVGELTDTGGDEITNVWFEYGTTTSYGHKTGEKILTQSGIYCITITGLTPFTTYNYRAAARNSVDTSFGQNKSFTTVPESTSVQTAASISNGTNTGAVTSVSTGLTDNFFVDSFFLPLLFALAGIWVFKSRILRFEEWKDKRKTQYEKYRAEKVLFLRIAKIRATEFLRDISNPHV